MAEEALAQPFAQMFERNCGHIAKRAGEVEVFIEGLPEPKVGFLAGLDDEYLQVCLTKSQQLSNVRRDMIVSLDETGRNLTQLAADNPEIEAVIRKKVFFFQKRAIAVYGEPRIA